MGKAKTWTAEECEAAARAYVESTLDDIRGAEQKGDEFGAEFHQAFAAYAPPGVRGTGTWTDRDPDGNACKVWHFVRNTILKDVQRFYRTLNAVLNMELSGVTHEQKVNIAVAMFLKKIQEGKTHYDYRDFDANKWRLFKAYLVLKETGKLAEPTPAMQPSQELAAQQQRSEESGTCTDENEGFITDSSALKATTRRSKTKSYSGRDAAKGKEKRELQLNKKVKALQSFARTKKKKLKVMNDIKTQVQTQNIVAMLSHPAVANNEAMSKRLARNVLKSLGMNKKTTSRNAASMPPLDSSMPGDINDLTTGNSDDDDEDSNEDSDSEVSMSSSESSRMNRPAGGSPLRRHLEAKVRGRRLALERAERWAAEKRAEMAEADAAVGSVADAGNFTGV